MLCSESLRLWFVYIEEKKSWDYGFSIKRSSLRCALRGEFFSVLRVGLFKRRGELRLWFI